MLLIPIRSETGGGCDFILHEANVICGVFSMFVNLFIFFVAGCITAQESEKIELGMNVITQCVVPGMVALTYDDGVS